ncbi:hypothetical protein FBULB1_1441 [Fusarium bulbicola]|nr:hypothetical protein FBULB1_1441 [Fusarium bulbicola]
MYGTANTAVKRRPVRDVEGRPTKRQMGGHGEPISSEVAISQEPASDAGHQDPPFSIPRCRKTKEAKDTNSINTNRINSEVKGQDGKINENLLKITYRDRVNGYHFLCDYMSQDEYGYLMDKVHGKYGEELYAQALHDSPAKLRQVKLTKELEENRDSDMHRRLIQIITELEKRFKVKAQKGLFAILV